ncbi:MAG: hypothetical protein AAGI24_10080 [Pseudomonadota bacterium]
MFCSIEAALADPREQARRMHDRLVGVPPSDEMLGAMTDAIASGKQRDAALLAMDGNAVVSATGDFYTVTLKNWAAPWTNEAMDVFAPLNDYSATVIGVVRDNIDFRELLYADIIYTGAGGNLPAYSVTDNRHYEQLESSGANLGDAAVLVRGQQSVVTGLPADAVAGVITSRASARAFFVDGTNRAMFRFTVLNHLCMDMEQLKDSTRPADRIQQDVSRSPGGDSTLFLNGCVTCHAGMDPLAQAFAYYDFDYPDDDAFPNLSEDERKDLGQLVYTPGQVQPKYLINASTFAPGFVTQSNHWTNYWRLGANSARVGWQAAAGNTGSRDMAVNPEYAEGDGAASLGRELANSDAFSQCQVRKAFRSICLREPVESPGERAAMDGFINSFNSEHNMKHVFADVASYCAATP